MSGKLAGKIAVITGASRGIGAQVAKKYASEGAHVILIARTISGLEEVDDYIKSQGGKCTLVPMDVKDGKKIDELGGIIAERFGRVDIFVGNAGILGMLSPVGDVDPAVWDKIIATNLTANYRFIRSFDKLFRAADAAKVIFVTSEVASEEHAFWGAYAASKAGLEILARTYAKETSKTNICVNLVDPGTVGTRMIEEAMPGNKPEEYTQAADVAPIFLELSCAEFQETGKKFKGQ